MQDRLSYGGYGGHRFFIGAQRTPGSGQYYWVDAAGNQTDLSMDALSWFWLAGEPSYGDENCVFLLQNAEGNWRFNDVPDDVLTIAPFYSGEIGYIIEFEE